MGSAVIKQNLRLDLLFNLITTAESTCHFELLGCSISRVKCFVAQVYLDISCDKTNVI